MCLFLAVVLVFGCNPVYSGYSSYDGYSSYYHHDYYRHDYPRDDWNYDKYSHRTSTAPYHHDYADNYDRHRNLLLNKGKNYYYDGYGGMPHMNTLSENGENYDIYEFDSRGNSTYNSTHNSYYYLPVHAMSKYDSYYYYYYTDYYHNDHLDSRRDNDRLYESTSSYEATSSPSYETAYAYDPRNHFYGRKPYRTTSYPRSVYRTFSQYHRNPYTTTAYDDGYDGASCAIVSTFEVPSIILLICLTIITSRLAWLLRLIENSQPEIPLMPPQKMVVMVQHVDRDMVVMPTTVVADEDKEQTKTDLGSEQNV